MTTDWKTFERTIAEADVFVGRYDKTGKTFQDFWDEFNAKFPGIWEVGRQEGAPGWVAPALDVLAANTSDFDPERPNVDRGDLMRPGNAREGRFQEDLANALSLIDDLPELHSLEAESAVYRQYDRLVHYHPDQADAAHEAIRVHVIMLRQRVQGRSATHQTVATADMQGSSVQSLQRGMASDWAGKTYEQFWDWFNAVADRIEKAAPESELEEVRQQLLDLRDSANDAYPLWPGRENEIIGGG